jgi:hypothetical protein
MQLMLVVCRVTMMNGLTTCNLLVCSLQLVAVGHTQGRSFLGIITSRVSWLEMGIGIFFRVVLLLGSRHVCRGRDNIVIALIFAVRHHYS